MGVRIRNPSVEICGLPFPLRGVLQGGQRIIVSTTLSVLTAACPSLASTFKLTDLGDDYSGPDDDTTYGITDDAGSATFKDPCRAATTADITLSAAQTIDGVSVVAGDRVLVKNQSTGAENGLYLCAAGAWTRAIDLAAGASAAGMQVLVLEGTVSADVAYICTNNVGSDVVGTDALVFASGTVVDSLLVHKAGTETITGVKTFSAPPVMSPAAQAIASQAIGDLLVASSTSAMARLPDVATGQVLKSGGVGALPAYGAIGGTTAAGGTDTVTGATASSAAAAVAGATGNVTGSAPACDPSAALSGTGLTTAAQAVTTTSTHTVTLDQYAGYWLIGTGSAPALILSHPAATGAAVVFTVAGLAPTTDAGAFGVYGMAGHAHGSGTLEAAAHTHGAGTLAGPSHTHSGTGLT